MSNFTGEMASPPRFFDLCIAKPIGILLTEISIVNDVNSAMHLEWHNSLDIAMYDTKNAL